jgi:hypothetical protein
VRKSTIYLFALGLAVAIVTAGAVVSAQNTNSSMTMSNGNTGTMKHKPSKRKPRSKASTSTAGTDTGAAMPEAAQKPRRTGRCDPTQQEQADLSGTYTGKVNYPDASLTGDATLTITGNNFTLSAGSSTQSGRITAVTTCGYTGATMMFGDLTPPTPSPNPPAALPAVSLRARKMGDRVTLMTVPGERRSFSFGTAAATRQRRQRPKADAPATTPPQQ